jgi:hypothetical protein
LTWLEENYFNNNGLQSFFSQGGYSLDMRVDSGNDYMCTVQQGINIRNEMFRDWAINVKENKYSVSIVLNILNCLDLFLTLLNFRVFLIAFDFINNERLLEKSC